MPVRGESRSVTTGLTTWLGVCSVYLANARVTDSAFACCVKADRADIVCSYNLGHGDAKVFVASECFRSFLLVHVSSPI